ncbi:MAG: chemotaxis protein CheW [Parachlamydiaceae bacterium]|nr:MAG: chemotaxis protein CheW [Parachlamydiaceae bacterium]
MTEQDLAMDILIYSIDEKLFGVEIGKVQSVISSVEVTELPNVPHCFLGAINVHGELILVLNLRHLFGMPAKELDITDQFILCTIRQNLMALWVDDVKDIRHLDAKELISLEKIFQTDRDFLLWLKRKIR